MAASSIGATAARRPRMPSAIREHLDRAAGLGLGDHAPAAASSASRRCRAAASTVIGSEDSGNASIVSHAATLRRLGDLALLARPPAAFFGVGFSVFSPCRSATAHTPRPVLAAPMPSTMRSHDRARPRRAAGRRRRPARLRVSRILTGKLEREDVQRRRRPADQAQRELGEEQHARAAAPRSRARRRRTCRAWARTVWREHADARRRAAGTASNDAMKPRTSSRWPSVANSSVIASSW